MGSAEPEPEILACRLDADGLRRQRARYHRLGLDADAIEPSRDSLTVRFRPTVDEALLREAIDVERGCCPFFDFDYSTAERLLRVTVAGPDRRDALDAIAFALTDPGRARRPGE
jgi:hypothetical protein